jgi:hypothetical protein
MQFIFGHFFVILSTAELHVLLKLILSKNKFKIYYRKLNLNYIPEELDAFGKIFINIENAYSPIYKNEFFQNALS